MSKFCKCEMSDDSLMYINHLRLFLGLTCIMLSSSCSFQGNESAKGYIEISYQLTRPQGIVPSYQTVVWLEDENGNYLKSLLVSEYLSYEGHNNPTICSDWSRVSDWKNVSEKEVDAITAATPAIDKNVLTIDCKKEGSLPGVYRYCVQTHIIENYNVLCRGGIEISGGETGDTAKVTYTPSKHYRAGEILRNVRARYCR